MNQDLTYWDAIKSFQSGDLSLGQLSNILGKNKFETIKLLGLLGIAIADYDLEEDLSAIKELMS